MLTINKFTRRFVLGLATLALVLAASGLARAQFEQFEPKAQQPRTKSVIGEWTKDVTLPDGRPGYISFYFGHDHRFIYSMYSIQEDHTVVMVKEVKGTWTILEGRYLRLTFANGETATGGIRAVDENHIALQAGDSEVVLEFQKEVEKEPEHTKTDQKN